MVGTINPWQRTVLAMAAILSVAYAGHAYMNDRGFFIPSAASAIFATLASASRKDGDRLFPKFPIKRILITFSAVAIVCAIAGGAWAWHDYQMRIKEMAASKAAAEQAQRAEIAQEVVVHCPHEQDDASLIGDTKHPLAYSEKMQREWMAKVERDKRISDRSNPATSNVDPLDSYFRDEVIQQRMFDLYRANGPRGVARIVRILRGMGDLPDEAEKRVTESIETLCSHHYQHLLDGPPV